VSGIAMGHDLNHLAADGADLQAERHRCRWGGDKGAARTQVQQVHGAAAAAATTCPPLAPPPSAP
jgi:hypothetical protein